MRQGSSAAAVGRRVNSKLNTNGRRTRHALAAAAAAGVMLACAGNVARAVTYTWANAGTDWNTPANWGAANFPQTNLDVAQFTAARTQDPNISASATISRIAFISPGSGYTITASAGQSLTLTATSGTNAIANAAGLTNGITAPIVFSPSDSNTQLISNSSVNANLPTLTLAGPITATAVNGVRLVGAATAITRVTNASNDFSGGLTLNVGKLNVGNNSALGASGNIAFTGGTLQYGSGVTQDFSGRIVNSTGAVSIDTNGNAVTFSTPLPSSNTGGLTVPIQGSAGSSLTLATANSFTGTVAVTSGSGISSTLNIQNALSLGASTNVLNVSGPVVGFVDNTSAGPLTLANGLTLGGNMTFPGTQALTMTGPVTISGAFNRSITVNGAPMTLTGNATGAAGRISKGGNGTLTLSGDNSALLGVNLNGGRLNIGSATALGVPSGASTNAFNATGAGVSFDNITGSPLAVANSLAGFDWTFVGSSNLTFNGTADISIGGTAATSNHTVTMSGTNSTLTSAGAISNTVTDASVPSANVNNGVGASGNTLVIGGGAKLTSATSLGMTLGGNGNALISGPVVDGAQAGGNLAVSGGIWTLSGPNSYTGTTTVNGGRLQTTRAASLPGYNSAAKVTVNSTGTLGVNAGGGSEWTDTQVNDLYNNATFNAGSNLAIDTTGGNFAYGFAMGKANGLVKLGANTLTLGTANTYTGGTTVSAGTLVLANADVTAGGAINVANGALAQAQAALPKAVTVSTLATNTSGKFDLTDNSMVVRGMTVSQVGTLVKTGFAGGAWTGPGINSSTAAASTITAVGFADNAILGKTLFKGVSVGPTDVLVKYTYYGDADLSGATTLDDFTLFLNGYQTGGTTWVQGDFDYSGTVTLDDFTLFLGGYQNQGAPLSALEALINATPMSSSERQAMLAAVEAVPEPTATAAMLAAGMFALRRRRSHA